MVLNANKNGSLVDFYPAAIFVCPFSCGLGLLAIKLKTNHRSLMITVLFWRKIQLVGKSDQLNLQTQNKAASPYVYLWKMCSAVVDFIANFSYDYFMASLL
ncbi:MAG: hypothetical protein FWC78_09175 [Defluviitaleaceae bacterium]|nr:hypothetical protein [Defluviitaleaceae bacterium]